MPPTILFAVSAFVICVALIPFLRRAAVRWHLYDQPGALKIHRSPIPRLGGIAMMAGMCACLVPSVQWAAGGGGLCSGAFCLVWAVGLADDLKSLPPLLRLVVHLAAGALLGSAGWRLHWFNSIALDVFITSQHGCRGFCPPARDAGVTVGGIPDQRQVIRDRRRADAKFF